MTKNEHILRAALLDCQALLIKLNAQNPTKASTEVIQCAELALALNATEEALKAPLTPRPRFYVSGSYVRGPARPSGSGYKETVMRMANPRYAQMTAETLNEFFDAYGIPDRN